MDQMMLSRRLAWFSAHLLALAAMAACGGGGSESLPSTLLNDPPAPTPAPAPAPAPSYTVSGAITVTDASAIDSDTNDPNQVHRKDNGTFEAAQPLPNPVQLLGYLTMPGGVPSGVVSQHGDLVDGFKLYLQAGQVVELKLSSDPAQFDIDLFIFDASRQLVGVSSGVNQYECVQISSSGDYFIAAEVFAPGSSNGSIYQLRIGVPGTGSSCSTSTTAADSVIPNEIIALGSPAVDAGGVAESLSGVTLLRGNPGTAAPHLVKMPSGWPMRTGASERMAAASRQSKGLSARTPAFDQIAAQTDAWRRSMPSRSLDLYETFHFSKLMVASGAYRHAEPNRKVSTSQTTVLEPYPPNDRDYVEQRWHYEAINLPSAMEALQGLELTGSPAPIVAVVDSGIVAEHPDLAAQLVAGYDFVASAIISGDGDGIEGNPDDASTTVGHAFHGTHVAGTVAAQTYNGIGGASVAPIARIMPVRVLGVDGQGSMFDVIEGVRYAAGLSNASGMIPARRADIINLSLGGEGACGSTSQDTFYSVRAAGVVVVAAAGNGSTEDSLAPVRTPANCDTVFSIAAIDAQKKRAYYSNAGQQNFIAAPGGDTRKSTSGNGLPDGIYSTFATISGNVRSPSYMTMAGTSMATPHAAGVFALMRWIDSSLTVPEIESMVIAGALVDDIGRLGRDDLFGYGLINARKSVDAALASRGGTTQPPPAGQIEAQPRTIGLGTLGTEADLVLAHVGPSSERVVSVTTDSRAISVGPKAPGATDATTGLGTYVVLADRTQIAPGTSVFVNVIIRVSSDRTITVPVSISRPLPATAGGSLGPAYVLVLDANDPGRKVVAKTMITTPVAGIYRYSATVPGTTAVSILAGSNVDNDDSNCGAGEACGAYPTLSGPDVLRSTGDLTGIDFSLSPAEGPRGSMAATLRRP